MTLWQANSGWVLELPRCLEELAGKQCFFHDSSETIQFHSQPWHLHVQCLQLLRTCLWNSFLCTTCLWNSFRDKQSLVKKTSSTAVIEITHLLISYRLKAATQLHKRHGRLHNHLLLAPTRWMGLQKGWTLINQHHPALEMRRRASNAPGVIVGSTTICLSHQVFFSYITSSTQLLFSVVCVFPIFFLKFPATSSIWEHCYFNLN